MKVEKILIVDDEPWAQEMMQEILEREGYQAQAAGSGEEALRLAEGESFDLLLADIIMPKMGGLELVQEFRAKSPETVPMLITGYASIETAQAAMRQGVYDYIVKPFDRAELCAAVAKALRRKRVDDESYRIKGLVGLYKVSQSMVTSQEQREVLEFVLNAAVHQTRSSGGAILLFDTVRQGLVIAAALGAWQPAARIANAMLEEGISAWMEEISSPTLFTDVEHHPLFARVRQGSADQKLLSSRSKDVEMLLLPIKSEREIFGVLNIYREGEEELLSQSDLELLTILATQAGASIKSRQLFSELENGCYASLRTMASLVDGRSLYTQGHMERVAQLSEQLARRLGFSESEVKMIRMGASLHDIGRIGVGEEILSIPGKLSPQEWDVVRRHPIIGDEIIAPLRFLAEARHIVRHHHERLDGGGYPDGLSGEQVTPALQVVSLADSYDALTSPRPWRPAIPREEALAMLEEERGSRFDPQIVDTFAEMMREE
jgi:response regulator RpfG family c-di-GMP phosphodiesterase